MASINDAGKQAIQNLEGASAQLDKARAALKQVIFGQEQVIDLCLTTIIAGGHGLIVGAPGLAKTKLASALGRVLGPG
jgi:MoxR-like ATPase